MDIPEGGPIPTSFQLDTSNNFILDGKVYEVIKPEEVFDDAFGFKIKSFSDRAEFRQRITAVSPSFTVKGAVNFMACNNVTCSPPKDVEFEIRISDIPAGQVTEIPGNTDAGSAQVQIKRGLLGFFLISLLAGLAGILTPCVFPMIP